MPTLRPRRARRTPSGGRSSAIPSRESGSPRCAAAAVSAPTTDALAHYERCRERFLGAARPDHLRRARWLSALGSPLRKPACGSTKSTSGLPHVSMRSALRLSYTTDGPSRARALAFPREQRPDRVGVGLSCADSHGRGGIRRRQPSHPAGAGRSHAARSPLRCEDVGAGDLPGHSNPADPRLSDRRSSCRRSRS